MVTSVTASRSAGDSPGLPAALKNAANVDGPMTSGCPANAWTGEMI